MKKSGFYDAIWERITALRSYKLISVRGGDIRITKRGFEFLKHENKEYYLGKILLMDKYKRTRHPEIFTACLEEFVNLPYTDRKLVKKVLHRGTEIDYNELKEKDWGRYREFITDVNNKLQKKYDVNPDVVGRVCDYVLRNTTVGTKAPMDIPIQTLRKILSEMRRLRDEAKNDKELEEKVGDKSFVVQNLLELHLEDIIRRNFKSLFPNLEIIDNGQHYYTEEGNYIDILCKDKINGGYVIIELKRDRSPSSALIQLLDYMNQIMKSFKTKKVKGILICKHIDKKTESALTVLRKKLKQPDDIKLKEFNLEVSTDEI